MNPMVKHLSRFDLVSVRLLVDCVQHGSLSAAAERSHLALPAASRRIKDLELAVGADLFERQGRRLQATPAGRTFYRHGVGILQAVELLGAELTNMQLGTLTQVRLSASTAALSQSLSPILRDYAREFPRVRVHLEEQVSEMVVKSLHEGRADVGVFVEGQETQGLDVHAFDQDELVFVFPPGHRFSHEQTPLAFAEALDEDWISFSDGAALLRRLHEAAHAEGRVLKLRMQTRSFDTMCHLVAARMGIAMLPGVAAQIARGMGLVCRPLAEPWAIRQLLVATRSGIVNPHASSLVLFIREHSRRHLTEREGK
ncbi:LysR substrate-binding domain-containing protein [Ramlibacter sp.]|uniref:LysR substrate-binding domain-containing protein n=1 Tax=Ramlibacter sp. TaxID=1917967 RepID=UPI003D0B7CD6